MYRTWAKYEVYSNNTSSMCRSDCWKGTLRPTGSRSLSRYASILQQILFLFFTFEKQMYSRLSTKLRYNKKGKQCINFMFVSLRREGLPTGWRMLGTGTCPETGLAGNSFTLLQCCGSGMFIFYPGSRIKDSGSRIRIRVKEFKYF